MNEPARPWFTREDTGTIQFTEAAVQRVIARGSDPEAITEAEGDFGPDGTFSLADCLAGRTDPHQCDCTASMFGILTSGERLALRLKLSGWASQFCMVGHTLARVGLAHDEYAGHLWQRREPYVDIMHELHDLGRELAAL